MADTTIDPNNRAVVYRGKTTRERPRASAFIGDQGSDQPDFTANAGTAQARVNKMSMRSKAQSAAMHAAASGNSTLGIPKSVGQDFVSAQHGKSLKGLPTRVKKRADGGPVSPPSKEPTPFEFPKGADLERQLELIKKWQGRTRAKGGRVSPPKRLGNNPHGHRARLLIKIGLISPTVAAKRKYAGNSDDIQGLDASSR